MVRITQNREGIDSPTPSPATRGQNADDARQHRSKEDERLQKVAAMTLLPPSQSKMTILCEMKQNSISIRIRTTVTESRFKNGALIPYLFGLRLRLHDLGGFPSQTLQDGN